MISTELIELADKINEVYSYLADTEWNDEKQQVRNILAAALAKQDLVIRHACATAIRKCESTETPNRIRRDEAVGACLTAPLT